jgi:8-oxo-dGTP diphosphatase
MKVPRVGVGVIVIRDGKILMGKRKNAHGSGQWAPPGGHLEFGETVEACAIRELEEETGIKAQTCTLGGWENTVFSEEKHYITLFAYVTDFVGEPAVLEPEKCEKWDWFPVSALPKPTFPPIEGLANKGELERFLASLL